MDYEYLLACEEAAIERLQDHAEGTIESVRAGDTTFTDAHYEEIVEDEANDYCFEGAVDIVPSQVSGYLALNFTLLRDGGSTMYLGTMTPHLSHYYAIAPLAAHFGGHVTEVRWKEGGFTIEVYLRELALADIVRIDGLETA